MSIKTTITVNGVTFSIVSDEASEEQLQKAAAEVNDRITQVKKEMPTFDAYQAMAFAMFRLAGEYEDLKYKHKVMQDRLNQIPVMESLTSTPKRSYNAQKKAHSEAVAASKTETKN